MIKPEQHIIVVSGATGQQGGAVARHLLKRGFRVRALTRNPEQEKAEALARRGAEVVKANLHDRASLDRPLSGAYGAYSVQTFFEEGVESEIRQGKIFADAAKGAGIKHVVYSSVIGADRQTGIPHFESKWEIEEHIRKLGLPATILRPVSFMENWAFSKEAILNEGKFALPLDSGTSLHQIAVDDIGYFAGVAFADPEKWIGQSIELAGDKLTMAQTAETFSRLIGKQVHYEQLPWKTFEEQAGKELTSMYRWFEEYNIDAKIAPLYEIHPRLLRLEPFLKNQKWLRRELNN